MKNIDIVLNILRSGPASSESIQAETGWKRGRLRGALSLLMKTGRIKAERRVKHNARYYVYSIQLDAPERQRELVITLEWLQARVKEDDTCGCWIWKGATTAYDQPQASLRRPDGSRKTVLVRRMVWEMKSGRKLRKDNWAATTCDTHGCVHPDHVTVRTRSKAMRGAVRTLAQKANMAAGRRKNSKFDIDKLLAEIEASAESNVKLAARLGCHHSYVAKIRNGEALRNYSSPFAGLLSAL